MIKSPDASYGMATKHGHFGEIRGKIRCPLFFYFPRFPCVAVVSMQWIAGKE
jgi:hypothetical protein